MRESAKDFNSNHHEVIPTIIDIEDARDYIRDKFENGVRPLVTVPQEYKKQLKEGFSPHSTWIEDLSIITGTIGRDAYIPKGEERAVVVVHDIDETQIEPRFTGDNHAFHGVVVLKGPIKPSQIEIR